MSREARVVLPNCPHHVVHRGHNRSPVFADESHFECYLGNLVKFKFEFDCRVYAFCLMTNHVHLVVDPGSKTENLALLMKRLAGRQTRYANRLLQRTGTLWEGRFKSSPIQSENYLIRCCRYVELNPLRAGLVSDPAAYRWSSCAAKVGDAPLDWLDLDESYLELADTPKARQKAYRYIILDVMPKDELEFMRKAVQRGQLTGDARFQNEVEQQIGRRIEFRGRGRPRKNRKWKNRK